MCALVSSAVVCVHRYPVPWNVCTGISCHGMCALASSATECVHWYQVLWYVCTGIECHGMYALVSSAYHSLFSKRPSIQQLLHQVGIRDQFYASGMRNYQFI